jgi:hypothetical protein
MGAASERQHSPPAYEGHSMKRIMRLIFLVIAVACGLVLAGSNIVWNVKDRGIRRDVNDLLADKVNAQLELKDLQHVVDQIGQDMRALPDSLRPLRMGEIMTRSKEIAKRQGILIANERKADAQIHDLYRRQDALVATRRLWNARVTPGFLGGLLGVVLFSLRRKSRGA